jgi:hypothetical protein
MKTHLEFKSDKFPTYGDETEGVNWEVGIYGRRLAEFLKQKLTEKGITVSSAFDEDWGWCIEIEHEGNFRMFVGCGPIDDTINELRCFIEPSTPTIKRWFKSIDVQKPVEELANAVFEALSQEPGVNDLRWVTE